MATVTRCRYGCRASRVEGRTMCRSCLSAKKASYCKRRSMKRCAQCGEPSVTAWCRACLDVRIIKGRVA